MKKQTMYHRLQKQYTKLNQSIQKAMQTGRFYAYTQFKQQQLLSRLKRCSFQLKQLGAGVAVVGALGMATPAVGQYVPPNFISRTGVDNPCDLIGGVTPEFVDIDGDGDMDCFTAVYDIGVYSYVINYYENTGDIYNAEYTQRNGAANPFDGIIHEIYLTFVDIDNDGDMDCFMSANYSYNNNTLSYYENTGSATNPVFAIQPPVDNPLNTVVTTYGMGNIAATSFVDIDNDGDMDCFVGLASDPSSSSSSTNMLFYENTGSITTPVFVFQSGAGNLLSMVDTIINQYSIFLRAEFVDMDKDGDQDAFVNGSFTDGSRSKYYENVGTAAAALFTDTSTTTPVDSIFTNNIPFYLNPLDIDGDTDIDFMVNRGTTVSYILFENQDSVITSTTQIMSSNLESIIYPNPTSNILHFDQSIEGIAKLYNVSGQLVLSTELQNEQELNIGLLSNGIYFLEIQTEKGRIREKVILQK